MPTVATNGRAAILNNSNGANVIYTAGNAGNGANPQPPGILLGAGAQIITASTKPEIAHRSQECPRRSPASTSAAQLGLAADKTGKDDNFRGMTVFNNVLYYTKGSGGNGVDTVLLCGHDWKRLPQDRRGTSRLRRDSAHSAARLQPHRLGDSRKESGRTTQQYVHPGGFQYQCFAKTTTNVFPFGIWFADANTLYVADEGDGTFAAADVDTVHNIYTHPSQQTTAGLQKRAFNSTKQQWVLAYTLQSGLQLGVPYTVPGYPAHGVLNPATSLPWAPAADGLRNITGRVEWDGKVTIWGITSTVSGNGDQGADPNRLVAITDVLANTDASIAAKEEFHTLRTARYAEVLRGVSFHPKWRPR